MTKIKAVGKRSGKELTVEVIDSVTYLNGKEDDRYDLLIQEQHPIGGTYYAEPKEMTNILNTLANHFFDDKPKINTEGNFEEIPYEDDIIY